MTQNQKKIVGKTVREFYFYPYRSKEENTTRISVWMASWIIGIVVQPNTNYRSLGGAYLIYSISLLLEFIPEKRTTFLAKIFHTLFCALLILIFIDAWIMIFGNPCTDKEPLYKFYHFLEISPLYAGWMVFAMMFIGLVLVLAEAHKCFYDEDAELQQQDEASREIVRESFYEHLNGNSKGGDM